MGLTRRELFAGPAAAVLAGGLGASCGGAVRRGRTALTAAGPPRPVPCGVDAVNMGSFEALTGTFAKYLRVYHGPHWPLPASLDDPPAVRHYLHGGRHVVISFSPPRDRPETENRGRFGAWCASAARAGFAPRIRATVYHEPVHKIASGAEFIRRYTAYQQVAFGYGIPFGVIHNAWPFAHGTARLADWMPPAARWDYLGIDVYAGDDPRGTWFDPVDTIAPFTAWATARGRPYGICEIGVDQRLYGTAAAAAAARNWLGRFTGLDGGCRWLCYFDYGPWSLKRNAGALVPAYRSLHHRLQAR